MKIECVAIGPNQNQIDNNSKIMCPELLASVGARYSRSDLGLDEIYNKVDQGDTEKSIDNIFRFIDYSHASIADMVPIPMFIDGISLWAAYNLFAQCPIAGGQESSTRYIDFGKHGLDLLIDEKYLPISKQEYALLFEKFNECCDFWADQLENNPSFLDLSKAKSELVANRLRRNYIFDRARYLLPMASKTNVMLVQSARSWVGLCKFLLSSHYLEFRDLGEKIKEQLEIVSPRMVKHAVFSKCASDLALGDTFIKDEKFDKKQVGFAGESGAFFEADCFSLDTEFLDSRENRYDDFSKEIKQTNVEFGWDSIPMAELRDLNRHRTGNKALSCLPEAYYCATEMCEKESVENLKQINQIGLDFTNKCRRAFLDEDFSFPYYGALGTCFGFEHVTTMDKFIYEAELRTGPGAHFKYKELMNEVLDLFYEDFPHFKGKLFDNQ